MVKNRTHPNHYYFQLKYIMNNMAKVLGIDLCFRTDDGNIENMHRECIEENCSDEEINKIYSLVMEKKRCENKNYNKKRIKISLISFATVAAIVCVCIYSIKSNSIKNDIENRVVQHTTDTPIIVEQNERIVVVEKKTWYDRNN